MKINSLRFRFALWIAVLLLFVSVVFGSFVYFSMARGLYAAVDESLALDASQVVASLNVENGSLTLPDSLTEPTENGNTHSQTIIRILAPDGKVLQSSGKNSLPMPNLISVTPVLKTWKDTKSGQVFRLYSLQVTDNNKLLAVVQVARSLNPEINTLHQLFTTILLGSPLLALFAALAGYFLAGRALAPIDAITRAAARISAEDLSSRINLPPTDDEVGRLAATFDGMLTRLDVSFRRERQFTSDASHELRTPLAAMQAILSVTRERRRSWKEYEAALDDLSEETVRLNGLTQDLLLMARWQGQNYLPQERVSLSDLLNDAFDTFRPLAEARSLKLESNIPGGLVIHGNYDSLLRLFINLLDNAIKFTNRGGVTLTARNENGTIVVEIADTGIGVSPESLSHIFDRFYRADASRTQPGSGLGLAIALEIARAHGGEIQVQSQPGKGTSFTVRLPSALKNK